MRNKKGFSLLQLLLVLFLVGLLVSCQGLQFKLKVENKLALAKEGGYQIMARVLKNVPEGEAKERLKASAETEFRKIRADLDNPELIIDASYLKSKLYNWIDTGLAEIATGLSEEDRRLFLRTQDFFALEGGYEATPEQRVIGIAFCDGVLEGLGIS
jgi:hypothetical protein